MVNRLFDWIIFYLPVFIPLAMAGLSVLTRLIAGTMELTLRAFLKTHTDLILGIFSFLIWALTTLIQTGQISLNSELMITPPKILILFLGTLMLFVVSAFVSSYQWPDGSSGKKHKERTADGLMLCITAVVFILPAFITTRINETRQAPRSQAYSVVIPYVDPTLERQIGSGRWGGRLLCEVSDVTAADESQAKQMAVERFQQSSHYQALFGNKREQQQAAIKQEAVLVRLK